MTTHRAFQLGRLYQDLMSRERNCARIVEHYRGTGRQDNYFKQDLLGPAEVRLDRIRAIIEVIRRRKTSWT